MVSADPLVHTSAPRMWGLDRLTSGFQADNLITVTGAAPGLRPQCLSVQGLFYFKELVTLKTLAERFHNKVDTTGGCHLWTGYTSRDGYGQMRVGNRLQYAHRVAWFLSTGKWPEPMALHRCDVPACVRAGHLREGTTLDNVRDRDTKKRGRPGLVPGENHPQAKLTWAQVHTIRSRCAQGGTQKALSQEYGVSRPHISSIISHTTWQ